MKQKIQNVGKFLRWTPWQVKLSMLVMGLGQLCYGQIVKGLFYLSSSLPPESLPVTTRM